MGLKLGERIAFDPFGTPTPELMHAELSHSGDKALIFRADRVMQKERRAEEEGDEREPKAEAQTTARAASERREREGEDGKEGKTALHRASTLGPTRR